MRLRGEVDLSTAAEVEVLLRAGETHCGECIVVDLGEVTFIDSRGVHLLEEAGRRAAAQGRSLLAVRASPAVQRVFEALGPDGAPHVTRSLVAGQPR